METCEFPNKTTVIASVWQNVSRGIAYAQLLILPEHGFDISKFCSEKCDWLRGWDCTDLPLFFVLCLPTVYIFDARYFHELYHRRSANFGISFQLQNKVNTIVLKLVLDSISRSRTLIIPYTLSHYCHHILLNGR